MTRLVMPALAIALVACGTSPRTQVMVIIDAEPGIRAQLGRLQIEVAGGDSEGGFMAVATHNPMARDIAWPVQIALIPRDGDASRRYQVSVAAFDESGGVITNVAAHGGYVEGRTLALRLLLEDACASTECVAQTCRAGMCTSPEIEATSLSDYSPPQADMDAGARDAGPRVDPDAGDAGDAGDAAIDPDACDPITQEGCADGEKCTWLPLPDEERTTCVAAGSAVVGAACSFDADGLDLCAPGLYCAYDSCAQICGNAPNTCGAEANCELISDVFLDRLGAGGCVPTCDPIAQDDCGAGEGCYYVDLASGITRCAAPADPPLGQGQECTFINHCEPGLGCMLPNMTTGESCTAFCDLLGGTLSCPAGLTCISPNDVVTDATDIPAHVGMCVDCASGLPGC